MSDEGRLDALLDRYEELRAQGTPVGIDDLCRDCQELQEIVEQRIRALESMNAFFGAEEGEEPATPTSHSHETAAAASAEDALAAGSRYRLLRAHAQGGLGEVHVARDEELNRDVALKRLLPRHARNRESRSRFLREAEITSRLEHPSIVPVHAVGRDAGGRPFYAMRFVQGETLHEASQRFHSAATPVNDAWPCAACWDGSWPFAILPVTLIAAESCTATSSRATSCWAPLGKPCSSIGAWRK
jgi:serine/threonine-protein kinase